MVGRDAPVWKELKNKSVKYKVLKLIKWGAGVNTFNNKKKKGE